MATVRVKGLREVKSSLRKETVKALRNKELLLELGTIAADKTKDVNQRTLSSSEPYYKWRERYDSLNVKDKKYSRNQIKMVFTGELLADLAKSVKVNATGALVKFFFNNSNKRHKKYNGKKGKIGSNSEYSDIQKGLLSYGYQLPVLSKETIEILTKKIQDNIVKSLRKVFKV